MSEEIAGVEDGARQGRADAPLVVRVEGDLDFETAPEMRGRLVQLLEQGHRRLVVDLTQCTYIDSSGMLALIAAGDQAAKEGGSVRLQNASPLLMEMLGLSHMGEVLGVPRTGSPLARKRGPVPDTGVGQWEVLRIVQPALPQSCALVRKTVAAEANTTPLTAEDRADLALAVGEAFANAVRHGSPQGEGDRVTVRVLKGASAFVAEVADTGGGFDSADLMAPDPEEMREGGLGVYYMQTLMDSVEFESGPLGTTVRLVKLYPS